MRFKKSKKALLVALLIGGFALAAGCGGDDDDDDNGGPLLATFTPSNNPPAANSLTLQAGSASGDTFTVLIRATDINDVFGATFDLAYDPEVLDVVSWSAAGSFLEVGGGVPVFLTFPTDPDDANGNIEFTISRLAPSPAVDVAGTQTLLSVTFEATDTVSNTPISFAASPHLVCTGEIDGGTRTCSSVAPVPLFAGGNVSVTN
jgi:hypothetical protein